MLDSEIKQNLMEVNNNYETNISGLPNLGNTCYMNSFLQILLHTPGFLEELKKERNSNIILVNSLLGITEEPNNSTHLKKIKQTMENVKDSYGQYVQNDSQEFGIDLINNLISSIKGEPSFSDEIEKDEEKITIKNKEEIKKRKFEKYIEKYYNKEKEIPLEKMFQFHESKIEIKSEENNEITEIKNINFETFINIDIHFQKYKKTNLTDLLKNKYFDYFFKEEDVKLKIPKDTIEIDSNEVEKKSTNEDVQEQEKEVSKVKAAFKYIKEMFVKYWIKLFGDCCNKDYDEYSVKKDELIVVKKIATLPKILIISINRALLKKKFNDNEVTFSDTLDVKKFIDNDLLKPQNTEYILYGINICEAHSQNYGHCYSYIKINNIWYKFNDSIVTKEEPKFSSRYVVGLYYINKDLYYNN